MLLQLLSGIGLIRKEFRDFLAKADLDTELTMMYILQPNDIFEQVIMNKQYLRASNYKAKYNEEVVKWKGEWAVDLCHSRERLVYSMIKTKKKIL